MIASGICLPSVAAGMAALQFFYNVSTGLWNTGDWWNSANALETTINYSLVTNSSTYRSNIFNTFEKHKSSKFLSPWFYDDEGWWALTWIKAYDLTGELRYLDMAKTIFNDMKGGWDTTCGGGIWWKKQHQYKNAIANELFLSVAARLHLRTPSDQGSGSYLDWAQREWSWFKQTGLINDRSLINDGLNNACQNNGQTTWTYNQGTIIGGLTDLYKSTNDKSLLTEATEIADATINDLAPKGILREPCEPAKCGSDGSQFKGIFIRNLSALYKITNKKSYKDFIEQNAKTIWQQSRNRNNQFGFAWEGPFDSADVVRQSSGMDAINAAILLSAEGTAYQAENSSINLLSTESRYGGYHGTGYVAGWNQDKQWVTFNVSVLCSGKYSLVFRYAAAAGNATRYILVNGDSLEKNQIFPATDNWSRWNTIKIANVWLNAGKNTVSVVFNHAHGSSNWLNLDELKVQ